MSDDRKAEVLRILVEEYIRSGEPVSSRAVLERSGLAVSSATIRNDLVALEREDLVMQPHTSAGRVPTAKAYRHYVDQVSPRSLRQGTKTRIQDFFASVNVELAKLLKATTELVSDITHYPAVVVAPRFGGEFIRGVHLVHVGERSVLVVLISEAGRVTQEVIRLETEVERKMLDRAETLLAEVLSGVELGGVGIRLDQTELPPDLEDIIREAAKAMLRSEESLPEVYVGGTAQLASLWEDLVAVNDVLEVLEREAVLVSILARASGGTSVLIGDELPMKSEADLAVVSATYEVAGEQGGTVGVFGPMRMNYRRAMSVVEEVGEGLAERLGP